SHTIQHAMKEIFKEIPNQTKFLELEQSRNFKLLLEWLTKFELARDDFSVMEKEKKIEIKLDGLSLSLRVDRIDHTKDNKQILIDYKTGNANPGEWFTERLLSPQLPLYSNVISPMGVYFAQTKKGEMGMKGIQYLENEDSSIKFIKMKKPNKFSKIIGDPTWENLLAYWKNKTIYLANEFLSGRLSIKPTLKQNTCKNCDLKSFCRIWELEHDTEGNIL
ncbi:MAG: PD-(D/E)XK nuclease family protein, partial [Nitrospinota bacterium]|nr:PD-(D/E)XK nuclease family protein [Nitrospinota bacterium]